MVSGDTDHGDHVVLTIEYGGNTATVYDRDTDHGKGISRKCKKNGCQKSGVRPFGSPCCTYLKIVLLPDDQLFTHHLVRRLHFDNVQ